MPKILSMNKGLLIISLCLASCSITNPYYLNLSNEKQKEFHLSPADSIFVDKNQVFSINIEELKMLMNVDRKDNKMLIFFTYWCPRSYEILPEFINQIDITNISLYFISPDDWVYKEYYPSYISRLGLNNNIFLLDVYNYGEKRSPHFKMKKFISEICTDCKSIQGFPSFILFNKDNEIVYKKVGLPSADTIREIVRY